MSEARFTPGPWLRDERTVYALQDVPAADRRHGWPDKENRFSTHPQGNGMVGAQPNELLANAILISAAPDLEAVAAAYEQWEADLISADVWQNELPRFTQPLWERFLEIQAMRNAALKKARGE